MIDRVLLAYVMQSNRIDRNFVIIEYYKIFLDYKSVIIIYMGNELKT